jgi:hypothetical protein
MNMEKNHKEEYNFLKKIAPQKIKEFRKQLVEARDNWNQNDPMWKVMDNNVNSLDEIIKNL